MTTLVDLRHWRIEADAVRLPLPNDGDAPSPAPAGRLECAEIILFPKIARALIERPRKSLKRRFSVPLQ